MRLCAALKRNGYINHKMYFNKEEQDRLVEKG